MPDANAVATDSLRVLYLLPHSEMLGERAVVEKALELIDNAPQGVVEGVRRLFSRVPMSGIAIQGDYGVVVIVSRGEASRCECKPSFKEGVQGRVRGYDIFAVFVEGKLSALSRLSASGREINIDLIEAGVASPERRSFFRCKLSPVIGSSLEPVSLHEVGEKGGCPPAVLEARVSPSQPLDVVVGKPVVSADACMKLLNEYVSKEGGINIVRVKAAEGEDAVGLLARIASIASSIGLNAEEPILVMLSGEGLPTDNGVLALALSYAAGWHKLYRQGCSYAGPESICSSDPLKIVRNALSGIAEKVYRKRGLLGVIELLSSLLEGFEAVAPGASGSYLADLNGAIRAACGGAADIDRLDEVLKTAGPLVRRGLIEALLSINRIEEPRDSKTYVELASSLSSLVGLLVKKGVDPRKPLVTEAARLLAVKMPSYLDALSPDLASRIVSLYASYSFSADDAKRRRDLAGLYLRVAGEAWKRLVESAEARGREDFVELVERARKLREIVGSVLSSVWRVVAQNKDAMEQDAEPCQLIEEEDGAGDIALSASAASFSLYTGLCSVSGEKLCNLLRDLREGNIVIQDMLGLLVVGAAMVSEGKAAGESAGLVAELMESARRLNADNQRLLVILLALYHMLRQGASRVERL